MRWTLNSGRNLRSAEDVPEVARNSYGSDKNHAITRPVDPVDEIAKSIKAVFNRKPVLARE